MCGVLYRWLTAVWCHQTFYSHFLSKKCWVVKGTPWYISQIQSSFATVLCLCYDHCFTVWCHAVQSIPRVVVGITFLDFDANLCYVQCTCHKKWLKNTLVWRALFIPEPVLVLVARNLITRQTSACFSFISPFYIVFHPCSE